MGKDVRKRTNEFTRIIFRFFTEFLPMIKENADSFGIFCYVVGMIGIAGNVSRLFASF